MIVELNAINGVTTEIKIQIPAAEADAKWAKHLQKYSKKADVPGFRKGKAPLQMVERMYSGHALEGFYHAMVDEYFEAAIAQENLEYLLFPDVKDITWEKGSDMEILVQIEHEPKIEFKQLDNLHVPYSPLTLESEVEKYLESLRNANTRIIDVDEAAEDDRVEVEYSLIVDKEELRVNGALFAGDKLSHRSLPELLGKKTGDVIEAELEGTTLKLTASDSKLDVENDTLYPVKIMVNSISRNQLPELNDDFARDMEFDDLASMKDALADELRAGNAERELNNKFGAIMNKLYIDNRFDLPIKTIEYLAAREAEQEPNEAYRQYLDYQYKLQISQEFIRMYLNKALTRQLGIVATDELTEAYILHMAILGDIGPEAYKEKNKEEIKGEDFKNAVENYAAFMKIMETAEFFEPDPAADTPAVEDAELIDPESPEEQA